MSDSLDRLYAAVLAARAADPTTSRTARLLRAGRSKMAKKLAEEAIEVVIDAMHGHSDAVVRESADLLYNLVVLWAAAGVHPKDVWTEMQRRERLLGIAEKLPKDRPDAPPRAQGRRARPQPRAQAALTAGSADRPPDDTSLSQPARSSPANRSVFWPVCVDPVDGQLPGSRLTSPPCFDASMTGASPPPTSLTRRG